MSNKTLNKKADMNFVYDLYANNLIDAKSFDHCFKTLKHETVWADWIKKNLLLFGSSLFLCGVIFFFAYNWEDMHKFVKLGIIQAGFLICAVGAFIKKTETLPGKIFLLCASVLTGVLFAVAGQIYQTGADPYGLFLSWAILILGFVIISNFTFLWAVWLIIANTAAILFWHQIAHPVHSAPYEYLYIILFFLNFAALLLFEFYFLKQTTQRWQTWFRILTFLGMAISITIPATLSIFDWTRPYLQITCILLWICCVFLSLYVYRLKLNDFHIVSLSVMNICFVAIMFTGKLIFSTFKTFDAAPFFLTAFSILIIAGAGGYFLKNQYKQM